MKKAMLMKAQDQVSGKAYLFTGWRALFIFQKITDRDDIVFELDQLFDMNTESFSYCGKSQNSGCWDF